MKLLVYLPLLVIKKKEKKPIKILERLKKRDSLLFGIETKLKFQENSGLCNSSWDRKKQNMNLNF